MRLRQTFAVQHRPTNLKRVRRLRSNKPSSAAQPDKTTLQVIDVEPHETEWCLETIEGLFARFYVGPAAAKAKKAGLNAKLAAGGKPPAK